MAPDARVVVMTPLKDARAHLDRYFELLGSLTYPHAMLSLAFLESDSADGTFDAVTDRLDGLRATYRRVSLWKRDFGFTLPGGAHRWAPPLQIPRRTVLAKSRNHLLSHGLDDEDWVLWLDVDVDDYPPDILERLLATGRDIVQPHCVRSYGGPTFDHNAWRDHGRQHLDDLRGQEFVRLDAVGGTMLLVAADRHRDGLVFPPFLYGRRSPHARDPNPFGAELPGEIETEGLGLMAKDMGLECWGLPHLEIRHVSA